MEEQQNPTPIFQVSVTPHSSNIITANYQNPFPSKSSNNNGSLDGIIEDITNKESIDSLPPGHRFCPTDAELIVHYLQKKINNDRLPYNQIPHVNVYHHSPDQISEMYPPLGVKNWYFFTPRDRKYLNGCRPNRAAGCGYWMATGADKSIIHTDSIVGYRKSLVYYEGKPPKCTKTKWIMHEYKVEKNPRPKTSLTDMRLDDFVLCRIYKKTDKILKTIGGANGMVHTSKADNKNNYLDDID